MCVYTYSTKSQNYYLKKQRLVLCTGYSFVEFFLTISLDIFLINLKIVLKSVNKDYLIRYHVSFIIFSVYC